MSSARPNRLNVAAVEQQVDVLDGDLADLPRERGVGVGERELIDLVDEAALDRIPSL